MSELEPGQIVGGVVIEAVLGRGRVGVVYRGWDIEGERPVAVRAVPVDLDAEALGRLGREFRATCDLDHPHLIRNHRLSTEGSPHLMIMEFVDGQDLEQRLAGGPLAIDEALRLGAEVARALGALHDRGLVHRDVKPSNILVDGDGRARLGDLELVKPFVEDEAARVTEAGTIVGTPAFVALEVLLGDGGATPWSDMYSFGATLYALLAGHPPYEGRSSAEVFRNAFQDRRRPLAEARPETPPEVVALVERLMAREPASRPARGAAVADELDRIRTGL